VVGLNYKDPTDGAQRFLRQLGDPYVITAVDADGRAAIEWGVYGVPETFVIDKAGIVRFKHVGPLTEDVVAEEIVPLLRRLNS
jgi:cytochrome c biogenesis protein CcmG/thiol:disulfide interchange protein DsbE